MSFIRNYLIEKENKKYKKYLNSKVSEIRKSMEFYKGISDKELRSHYETIKQQNKPLIDKLVEVYAITGVVAERTLGLSVYDVQLQGAVALFEGNIAEMKTGEGKTLTSAFPIVLRATEGLGCHVVTVNEYLTQRDHSILEPIYTFLGLTSSVNLNEHSRGKKKESYKADIMYSTASELGFDYLRDNMVSNLGDKVNQRTYNYALIDEVDLVLIDEARTPLIIGKPFDNDEAMVIKAQYAINKLKKDDLELDFKNNNVTLLESGQEKIEEYFNLDNLYSEDNTLIAHYVHQALIANFIFMEDKDYAITKSEGKNIISIIDTFTGRISHGRRFTNGLHQALEAKHIKDKVEILEETKSVATITLQNFFRLYTKLAGMTGTGKEERSEFMEIYGLNVVEIDTNKPVIREDKPIIMYNTKAEKWKAVTKKTVEYHNQGHPVLIGTVSVEDSEILSKHFKAIKLKHQVLNAKQDSKEAEIISYAGVKGAVTIATNMAGRGTDIKVDPDYKLVVISTELNESTRIDNQLKGRTSRQGAPGITETIISADDGIFSKTALSDRIRMINKGLGDTKNFIKLIKTVQNELESAAFAARRFSLKYDDIIREQRASFYNARNKVLELKTYEDAILYINKLSKKKLNKKIESIKGSKDGLTRMIRDLLLYSMDQAWINHIGNLETLKQGISWRAQSGHNPIIIYQNESKLLYDEFLDEIAETIIEMLDEMEVISDGNIQKNLYE